ncbi:MAG: putative glycosyltransferase/methyltransferase [Marmoricola sp.]|jgi:2-polyprenyl-3-methyl-5-hydroxy-6-metoxy-1,4-benzoquinol methylase|nr:putative glycosyltransferase/methyltransferase [Marmoricola sp.]
MSTPASAHPSWPGPSADREPRIGILVVAYNAASTLARTLERIPVEFRQRISEVFVSDDASPDGTYLVGIDIQATVPDLPITVIRHERNLGYGGNQKVGYTMAAEHGLDIVVLLHADGQYAPEFLPAMVEPLVRGEADAVFGSRMMQRGAALRGGMPTYKFIGNRILTTIENAALGTSLSEFHSGYRAYNVHALSALDLSATSDEFNFDTQIIIALHAAGRRIVEIPIPTFYGDEISHVNGMKYAGQVVTDVAVYRLATLGLTPGELADVKEEVDQRESEAASNRQILALLENLEPSRVLDVGCARLKLDEALRRRGHRLTGTASAETPEISKHVDEFVPGDLDHGLPDGVGSDFDLVVFADTLEHVRHPQRLLRQASSRLAPGGRLVVSVPNFGHWYPRARTVLGAFDYDQRGILDATHVRFFTRRSILRMLKKSGLVVTRMSTTGLPLDVVMGRPSLVKRVLLAVDGWLVRARPTLFAYEFIFEVRPVEPPRSTVWPRRRD